MFQSVPWEDDGRFLCANLQWVRTGLGRCPSRGNPLNLTDTNSLRNNGILLHVVTLEMLPYERDRYVGERIK
eukprot:1223180-Pyramimonas_sp.AAC.1